MTGKQLAAVSLLSAVVAMGAAVTGCSNEQISDVKSGKGRFDVASMEFKDNAPRPLNETDLPPNIQAQVHEQFPQGTVIGVEERKYIGGQTYYRVHVTVGEGSNQVEKVRDYNSGAGRYGE